VLRPDHPGNYYTAFDLVPINLRPYLQAGKVMVENWHRFAPESEHKEGDKSYKVVNKGRRRRRRLLGAYLGICSTACRFWCSTTKDIIAGGRRRKLRRTWKKNPDASAVAVAIPTWRSGKPWTRRPWKRASGWTDWIGSTTVWARTNRASLCASICRRRRFSSRQRLPGRPAVPLVGQRFRLVDAIESGIVKIPRLPVKDTAGRRTKQAGRSEILRLWHNIVGSLGPGEKYGSGKPKAEACYREAEGALKQIAGQWLERLFKYIQQATLDQERIPPVLIVVCDNIDIADYFYRKISGETESER